MIQFTCTCGRTIEAKDSHAGRDMRCPECGEDITIPEPGRVTADQPAPAPEARRPRVRRRAQPRQDEDYFPEPTAPRPDARTSRKAIFSLVLGICSFGCPLLPAIPGIILGIMGLREIGRSNGELKGQGLAIAGLVTSGLGIVVLLPLAVVIGLMLPAVQKVRQAADRMNTQNNLKQLGIALHSYHDAYGRFPTAATYDKGGKPLLSWRVQMLPYIGHDDLYKQFHLDEPWDSPHNKSLLSQMPSTFASPNRPEQDPTMTCYKVFVGPGAMFEENKSIRIFDVLDGTSNTLMIAESAQATPWTKPDDITFRPEQPLLPQLFGPNDPGFNVTFGDGSVRFLKRSISEQILRQAITRNGGELLPPGWDQ